MFLFLSLIISRAAADAFISYDQKEEKNVKKEWRRAPVKKIRRINSNFIGLLLKLLLLRSQDSKVWFERCEIEN